METKQTKKKPFTKTDQKDFRSDQRTGEPGGLSSGCLYQ